MRLIGGNLLKNSLLNLMNIAHRYFLLRISQVMMSLYHSGMDRVVIVSIYFSDVCVNGQESG